MMDVFLFFVSKILTVMIVPPFGLIMMALWGWWLQQHWPKLGRGMVLSGLVGVLLLSIPFVSKVLMAQVELPCHALDQVPGMQAIVVLGGGVRSNAEEYGGDAAVKPLVLERVRYGAMLHRTFDLPILVSGGMVFDSVSEATAMRELLEKDYGIKVRWEEPHSKTTQQNALLTASILKAEGIAHVVLVSQGWHLRRAVREFERYGMVVQPAATGCDSPPRADLEGLLPDIWSLVRSFEAFHEILGLLWYELLYSRSGD